jgi:hypothetical protein
MKRAIIAVLSVFVLAVAAVTGLAQAPQPGQGSGGPPAPSPDFVEHREFKNQVFDVKNRDPHQLAAAVKALGSGFRGATVSPSRDFNTITVRDFPENIATIGAAIARLDVAEPQRADVELHLHVLLASPDGTTGELPAEIRNAVTQLQNTLNYRAFTMLTPIVQRTREGFEMTQSTGSIQTGTSGPGMVDQRYRYQIRSLATTVDGRVELTAFDFETNGTLGEARVQSNLSLREGEQVVVGTASLRGKALVLVLSAKKIK